MYIYIIKNKDKERNKERKNMKEPLSIYIYMCAHAEETYNILSYLLF
jgi:hypothetical protein